jgi:hypothetical protein
MLRKPVSILLLLAGSAVFAAGPDKPLVAVVPISARSVDSASVAVVEDAISSELVKSHKVRVMERVQMDRILKEQGFQQTMSCDQGNCTMEIGRLLSVNMLLTGSLGKIGGTYSLSLRLVDVGTGEVTSSVTRTEKGDIEAVLTSLLPTAVAQLLSPTDPTAASTAPAPAPTPASAAPAPTEAKAESKHSAVPWIVGGVAVAGAGVAAAVLLAGGKSSSSQATTSVEVTLP